jgi:putative ATP-dependent endonuclease of the OLD family
LAEISLKDPSEFSADSFVARTLPVMTLIVNEGFFGDAVVTVEGLSEWGALWALQELMGGQWDAKGIVIVPCDGKSKIDRPTVIFRGFGIPTFCMFDGDKSHKGHATKEAATVKLNRLLLTLNENSAEDFPQTQVHAQWAILEDDLETEIRSAVTDIRYEAVREAVSSQYGYSKPSEALKNPELAAAMIRVLYRDGSTIPVLENIVQKISSMA